MFTLYDIMYIIAGLGVGFGLGYFVAGNVSKTRLTQLEEKFALQFENLANRIFDEKTDKFKKDSQEGIGNMLNPLRERLQEFQKKIDDSFGQQAKEQFSLKKEIENIVLTNEKMKLQTESLTKA